MDFGEKDEDVQDEVPQARYFTLKQFSKAHCDIENTKQTMWEAGPNLETRMIDRIKERGWNRKLFEKIMAENFPIITKNVNSQNCEAQQHQSE